MQQIQALKSSAYTRREKLGDFGNKILTGESSYRDTFEYILHPDKIKRLNSYGQGYFISRVTNEIKCVNFSGLGIEGSGGFIKKPRQNKKVGLDIFKRFDPAEQWKSGMMRVNRNV